jgi:hypothetical protein
MEFTERFIKRMPSLEHFEHMFQSSNLKCVQKLNILGAHLTRDYYNFEGPLDDKWRSTISYWSYATEEELEEVKRKVVYLKEKGELEKWCKEHDHAEDSGFLTVLVCNRL